MTCSSCVDAWYRFESAETNRMADKCVPLGQYACGTQHPIWMNGCHPTGKLTMRPS